MDCISSRVKPLKPHDGPLSFKNGLSGSLRLGAQGVGFVLVFLQGNLAGNLAGILRDFSPTHKHFGKIRSIFHKKIPNSKTSFLPTSFCERATLVCLCQKPETAISQKTREGCGCFRGLFSRKTPGKFQENCWKNFPESRNATNSRISGTGKGKPAGNLGPTLPGPCLHLPCSGGSESKTYRTPQRAEELAPKVAPRRLGLWTPKLTIF